MNVQQLLIEGISVLSSLRASARLECEVSLASIIRKNREYLFAYPEAEISEELIRVYRTWLEKLRNGYPLAYLTCEKEFYGIPFYVDERVLIPRPETEFLVEKVLELVSRYFAGVEKVSVLDVGTGSGCIAVSLAKNCSKVFVTASDVSDDALEVAAINIERNGLSSAIRLVESDLLDKFFDQKFDIIVANLPYIGRGRNRFIAQDVEQFEPHEALFGGEDGLELYKKLFQQVNELKFKPKFLLGEFGFTQSDLLCELLNKYFDQKYEIFEDGAGIERMFVIFLNKIC